MDEFRDAQYKLDSLDEVVDDLISSFETEGEDNAEKFKELTARVDRLENPEKVTVPKVFTKVINERASAEHFGSYWSTVHDWLRQDGADFYELAKLGDIVNPLSKICSPELRVAIVKEAVAHKNSKSYAD